MIVATYPDLTSLWLDTTLRVIREPSLWDDTRPPRLFSFPNMLIAESADLAADLSWVGLTRSRWTRFLNRYIDPQELDLWLDKIQHGYAATSMLFRTKVKDDHTGGECLIALSYRADNPTLTLYSREAEFPQRALLDTTFAHLAALAIGQKGIRVVWQLGGLYVSMLHALPLMARLGILEEVKSMNTKAGAYFRYMTNHLVKHSDSLKYGPAKRILKRWRAIEAGTMEPVPIDQLPISNGGKSQYLLGGSRFADLPKL